MMQALAAAVSTGRIATIASAALSGEAIGGLTLGIVMAILTAVGIMLTALGMARRNNRDYAAEIRAAEDRGRAAEREHLQPWLDYWRGLAEGHRNPPPPPTGDPSD